MISFFSVTSNAAAKPRSITKRARVSHSFLSHSSSDDQKIEWRKRAKFNCCSFFVSRTALFWCAAFIVCTKFEQLIKIDSRFIFSILFLSSAVTISASQTKEKLPFLSVYRLISCAKIFRNCTTDNKGLKSKKNWRISHWRMRSTMQV